MDLPEPKFHPIVWYKNTPQPKQDIDKVELVCFEDSAYENDPTNRISTDEFDFTFSLGAVFTGIKLDRSMFRTPHNQSLLML